MLRSIAGFCLVAMGTLLVGGSLAAAPEKKEEPVVKSLVITEADKGKTIRTKLGTAIEVRLVSDRVATGWSCHPVVGASVEQVDYKLGFPEFTPGKNAQDESIGTYHYRYKAKTLGKSELPFMFVQPFGPKPRAALAVQRIREFKVTVEVIE